MRVLQWHEHSTPAQHFHHKLLHETMPEANNSVVDPKKIATRSDNILGATKCCTSKDIFASVDTRKQLKLNQAQRS